MTLRELNNYKSLVLEKVKVVHRLESGRATGEDKKLLRHINKRLGKIADFIQSCPDPFIKQIMIYRFVEGHTWDEVAAKFGYSATSDSCRKLAIRYINRE